MTNVQEKIETLKQLAKTIEKKEIEYRTNKLRTEYKAFIDRWGDDIKELEVVHNNGLFLRTGDNGRKYLHSHGKAGEFAFYYSDDGWHLDFFDEYTWDFFDKYTNVLTYSKRTITSDAELEKCLKALTKANEVMPQLIDSAEKGITFYEKQLTDRLNALGGVK